MTETRCETKACPNGAHLYSEETLPNSDVCRYNPLDDEGEERDADEMAETFGYTASAEEARRELELQRENRCAKRLAPARERIDALLADMSPFRRMLLTILDTCREPREAGDLEGVVESLKSKRRSVYSAASLCTMLEEAGALRRLTEDGEPYEQVEPRLEEVQEGGRRYLRPVAPPAAYWQVTTDGLSVLEDDDPLRDLLGVIDQWDSRYRGVFQEILEMCAGEGSSITSIREAVNSDPVLQYPKKSAQFFMDYLDRDGAIAWDGAWKLTEVGEGLLERLQA